MCCTGTDIIQAVRLGSRERVLAFCRAVQHCSPVGAHILPTPGRTPGYGDEVVFADGTFVDGSTLELSADGPLREPFAVYVQGATHWTHWAIVLREALRRIAELDEGGGANDAAAGGRAAVVANDEDEAVAGGEQRDGSEERRYAGRGGLKNQ